MSIYDLFVPVIKPLGLWDSGARTAVMSGLLAAQGAADSYQRADWAQLREFLDGLHSAKIKSVAALSHSQDAVLWAEDPSAYRFFRLVEMLGERLAVIFHRPPDLFLVVDGEPVRGNPKYAGQVAQWDQDREDCELDTLLPTLDVAINVLHNQVVNPNWVSDGDVSGMRWSVSDPHSVYVHQSVSSPSDIAVARAVSFEIKQPVDSAGGQSPSLYSTWTRVVDSDHRTEYSHWVHGAGGGLRVDPLFGRLGLPDAVNPYGLIPAVLWQTRTPSAGCMWIPPDEALIQDQIGIDIALTDLSWGLKYYTHPAWIGKGNRPSGKLRMGPASVTWLDDADAALTSHTPDTNLKEVIGVLEWMLRMTAVSRSLPPDLLNPSAARNLAALQEQRHDLTIRRERVKPYYLRALRKTFEVHKAVSNFWARQNTGRVIYGDEVKLGVRLAPIPRAEDRWQAAQSRQLEIQQGLTSSIEEVMDRQGIPRAEAERLVAERLATAPPVAGAPQSARPEGDQKRPASVERG